MEMKRNLTQRAIPPRLAGIALSAASVLVVLLEWGAYQSGVRAEARATAHRNLPANFCVQCHSDPKIVQRMLEKDDNNGTIAYCAGVPIPSQFNHPTTQARNDKEQAGADWLKANK